MRHAVVRRITAALVAFASGITVAPAATGAPAAEPRIITLTPHATEMVYAAGGGPFVVGTISSSDFPDAARSLPRIGDGIMLNQERIVVLAPTLLVGWLRSGVALQIEPLAERLKADMFYARPERVRDIPADLRKIGRLIGTSPIADAAADALQARIDTLEQQYAGKSPVTVFIEVGNTPLYTIGSDPLLNDALRLCGAVNLYGDSGIPAPRVPIESVLVQNPQLIITAGRHGQDAEEARLRWAAYGLPAALKEHVHTANPDALFRPGPRFIDAIEAICPAVDAVRAPAGAH